MNLGWNILSVSVFTAVLVWFGFTAMGSLNPVIWKGRNSKLYMFDMTYELASILISAVILGLMSM